MYIYIIIKDLKPIFFIQKKLEEEFVYNNNIFNRVKDYTGVFYSYSTYKKLDSFFLAGIRCSFIFKHLNVWNDIKTQAYIKCLIMSEASDLIEIYINLQDGNVIDKVVFEEPQYCEIFNGDFLYKSEIGNLYCFAFEWLSGVKIADDISSVSFEATSPPDPVCWPGTLRTTER